MTEVTRNSKQQQYGTMGNPQPQPQEGAIRFEDVEWRQDDSSDPTKYAFWISSGVWVVSLALRVTVFNDDEPEDDDDEPPFTYEFGIPAYILCAIATCSFISAFVCFLLTWRSRSEKWPRIVAAAVLYPIAVVYFFFVGGSVLFAAELEGYSLFPLTLLLLASCGLMSAFVWAYQKLAWLRGIIGAALTVVFCGLYHFLMKEGEGPLHKFMGKHPVIFISCFSLVFSGILSSIAFTLVSFLFSTFCCCPSWKDDGDDSNTSIAARDGAPTGDQQGSPTVTNSNAGSNGSPNSQGSPTAGNAGDGAQGDAPQGTQQGGAKGSPTVTNSNAGNGSPNSQSSPTVTNSNAGDGAQGDGTQGTQQGGETNLNGQTVNYSGTDNNV